MQELLHHAELFGGLSGPTLRQLAAIGRSRAVGAGDYVFLLGDTAEYLYLVAKGRVELCFPMALHGVVKDVSVEPAAAGKILGWSALVKPYRFTLSARATEPSEVVGFPREELQRIFEADPQVGYRFVTELAELVGIRLLAFQALWVRELQRALLNETQQERWRASR
jgi:CRP-like cAMP-binding protein